MRGRSIITTALVAAAALGVAPGSGAAKSTKATKLACTLELYALGAPNPSGVQLGFASCPQPLGRGLHHSEYTVAPASPGHGTVTGRFRNYFRRGTTSGTFSLTLAATTTTDIAYTGTVTYTGGSGAFSHVRGHGTIDCTTADGGAHKACTVHSTLTGL